MRLWQEAGSRAFLEIKGHGNQSRVLFDSYIKILFFLLLRELQDFELRVIQCPEAMNKIYGQRKQNQCVGLMKERNDDVDIGENGPHPKCDLQGNDTYQPQQSFLYVLRVVLFLYEVIHNRYCDQPQPSKPTMNKDDGVWGFKEIDPRVEQVGWNPLAKHERPGI